MYSNQTHHTQPSLSSMECSPYDCCTFAFATLNLETLTNLCSASISVKHI